MTLFSDDEVREMEAIIAEIHDPGLDALPPNSPRAKFGRMSEANRAFEIWVARGEDG